MVGDLVSDGDEQWNHYLKLLEIIDYTVAPAITADKSVYIGMLIKGFLEKFHQLFPDRQLIPKMHYMVIAHHGFRSMLINGEERGIIGQKGCQIYSSV